MVFFVLFLEVRCSRNDLSSSWVDLTHGPRVLTGGTAPGLVVGLQSMLGRMERGRGSPGAVERGFDEGRMVSL